MRQCIHVMRYAIALAAALVTVGMGRPELISAVTSPTCVARADTRVQWLRLAPEREWGSLDGWCAAVGPPAHIDVGRQAAGFAGPIAIASWNDHVGAGDLDAFVTDLRAGRLTGGQPVSSFVVLMQEAYRGGPAVPEHDSTAL